MTDLISRQKAIEALDFKIVHTMGFSNDEKNITNPFAQYNKGLEDGIKAICVLPSAESAHKAPISFEEQLSLNCSFCREHECGDTLYESAYWDGGVGFDYIKDIQFCPICGRELYGYEDEKRRENE